MPVSDYGDIHYFMRATDRQGQSWEDIPAEIKNTYDKLGIPEAEKRGLIAGVGAQYESEVVYHSLREDLQKKGVIFTDTDSAVREHPDLVREYFGTIIPIEDNKFAALNSAVWSGGSFVYIPAGVKVDIPLQAYFHQRREHGAIREDPDHRRGGGPGPLRRGLHGSRSTPARVCIQRWSRSSSRRGPAAGTRPSRTGPTTSTTSSPSGRSLTRTP
ncbi:MAG: hypothetical protein U0800_04780 [Isosphaeraceae bacterium]